MKDLTYNFECSIPLHQVQYLNRDIGFNPKLDYVVIVHGLGFSKFFFFKIVKALETKGYKVVYFKYPTRKFTLDILVSEFLGKEIKHKCPDKKKKIHFVSHSFGGIMIRKYLEANPSLRTGRVVMIAPPNHGSEIVDILRNNFLFKILGPSIQQLSTGRKSYLKSFKHKIDYELGIIAGNSTNFLSNLLFKQPNDWLVTVKSTKIRGMKDHIIINASHLFILLKQETIEQIISFLERGKFIK